MPPSRFRDCEITISAPSKPPFELDGMVIEQDTFRVLGSTPDFRIENRHPIRVMTDAWDAEPEPPGSVLVIDGSPLRFEAIVHDLAKTPTSSSTWVTAALAGTFEECSARGVRTLALPLLGTRSGSLSAERSVEILAHTLQASPVPNPQRIWLVTPDSGLASAAEAAMVSFFEGWIGEG